MEWLALSNEELTRLAQADPTLAPYFLWGCLPGTVYRPPRIARAPKPTYSTQIRTGDRDSIGWPRGRRATTSVKSWTVLACRLSSMEVDPWKRG